jgi:hypothetical protein
LSWGDQPIPEPLEEVVDLESIAYNRRKQAIVKANPKKEEVERGYLHPMHN